MHPGTENDKDRDAEMLALLALGWVLQDDRRAERLLALTGLDAAELRDRATDPALLSAVIAFLENHEADLIACADAIGCGPDALTAAKRSLDA